MISVIPPLLNIETIAKGRGIRELRHQVKITRTDVALPPHRRGAEARRTPAEEGSSLRNLCAFAPLR